MAKKQKQDWIPKREADEPRAEGAAAPVVAGQKAEKLEAVALYALVLLCGIGLMSLEMVGARVLWNNFGSSVFVWGSIISVFMAALALGYYGGGLLADKKPSLSWLAGIVALAGASVLLLTQLSGRICNWVDGMDLGARGGPLVASLVLYFLPSVLLGMVSPFAVRLQAKALSSMGNVAGRLYALSTVGSLVGTLLTTFLLIPTMGTTKIIYSIGVILMAASVLGLAACFASRGGPRSPAGVVATMIFLSGTFLMGYVLSPMNLPGSLTPPIGVDLTVNKTSMEYLITFQESAYHNIAVIGQFNPSQYGKEKDKPGKVKPSLGIKQDPDAVLEMRFNNLTESALYPNREGKTPQTTYTRILHMGMAINPKATKVLVVGLGGGSVPREFCEVYADRKMQVDVVEVDPLVAKVASEHFFHRDAKGVRTFVTDGRQFVRRADRAQPRYFMGADEKMTWKQEKPLGKYDLIILDAYSGGGHIPAHLVTREFLEQCRARLAPDGVLVSNIISALQGPKSRFFRAEYKTMKGLFKNIYVFPSWRADKPRNIRNLILVATRKEDKELLKDELVAKAEALMTAYPLLKTRTKNPYMTSGALESFAEGCYLPSQGDLKNVPVLTDDYAPVETMFYWSTRFGR